MKKQYPEKTERITFRAESEILNRLEKEKERTGAPVSEIIRRAILQYLDKVDVN